MRGSSYVRGAAVVVAALLTASAAGAGCSSSQSGPPGLGQVAGALAAAYCQALKGCCEPRGFAYDDASCMAQKVRDFEDAADVVKRGKVVYDANAVEACASALRDRVSKCSPDAGGGADAGQAEPVEEACFPVFKGTVPPGQECFVSGECQVGSAREEGLCQTDNRPGADPKKKVCFKRTTLLLPGAPCRLQPKKGELETAACDARVAYCELVSPQDPNDPAAGTCRAYAKVGESCEPTGTPLRSPQCEPPSGCDFTGTKKCTLPPGGGQPCSQTSTACASGFFCDRAAGSPGTCTAHKPNGATCRQSDECAGRHCNIPTGGFDGSVPTGTCDDFGQNQQAVAFEVSPRSCGFGPSGSGPEDAGIQPIKTASFRSALALPSREGSR